MLGLKKNTTKCATGLLAKCEQLFAANYRLLGAGECCDYILNLASPNGREVYEMTVYEDTGRSYGLFAPGVKAGRGSFIECDGSFRQHGRITEADAARILATYTPVAGR